MSSSVLQFCLQTYVSAWSFSATNQRISKFFFLPLFILAILRVAAAALCQPSRENVDDDETEQENENQQLNWVEKLHTHDKLKTQQFAAALQQIFRDVLWPTRRVKNVEKFFRKFIDVTCMKFSIYQNYYKVFLARTRQDDLWVKNLKSNLILRWLIDSAKFHLRDFTSTCALPHGAVSRSLSHSWINIIRLP